jgi:hypothetical protein
LITLEDLFKGIGYEEIHELTPFDVVDDEMRGSAEWADSDFVGIRLGKGKLELEHDNLGWIYIKDLREIIKNIWPR